MSSQYHNPKNHTDHSVYDGAKFDMLDASFYVMVGRNYDLLIGCQGDDAYPTIHIPGHQMKRIMRMMMAQHSDQTNPHKL